MKRLARVARLSAIALLVVFLLLGGVEVACRIAFPEPPPTPWITHPFFQLARPTNYTGPRIDADVPSEKFSYEIDKFGFRGRKLQTLEKPAGVYRIFFVGGSTTENSSTPEDLTFAGLVQKAMDEKFPGVVEVANAGIMGARTTHSVAQIGIRLPPFKPDLILVLDAHNDMLDSLRDGYDPTTYGLALPQKTRFGDWLFSASRAWAVWETKRGNLAEQNVRDTFKHRAESRRREPTRPLGKDPAWNVGAFAASLRRIAAMCASDGVRLGFMTQPTLYKDPMPPEDDAVLWLGAQARLNVDTPTLLRGIRAYNDAIRGVATEKGALLVDLDPVVPKDREHFFDDAHLSRKGNAAVAKAVLEVLEKAHLPR